MFLSSQLANTLKDFDTVAQRSPKWNWPEHELSSSAKFYPRPKFKSGDVIWATKDNVTIVPFGNFHNQFFMKAFLTITLQS
jgi:hypothetical protein